MGYQPGRLAVFRKNDAARSDREVERAVREGSGDIKMGSGCQERALLRERRRSRRWGTARLGKVRINQAKLGLAMSALCVGPSSRSGWVAILGAFEAGDGRAASGPRRPGHPLSDHLGTNLISPTSAIPSAGTVTVMPLAAPSVT